MGSATRGNVFDWLNANQSAESCCFETDGGRLGRFLGGDPQSLGSLVNTSRPWNKLAEKALIRRSRVNGTLMARHHQQGPWSGRSGDDVFVRLDPGEEFMPLSSVSQTQLGLTPPPSRAGLVERETARTATWTTTMHHRVTLMVEQNSSRQGNLARRENGDAFTHLHATFPMTTSNLTQATCSQQPSTLWPKSIFEFWQAVMTRCPLENSEFVALKFEDGSTSDAS